MTPTVTKLSLIIDGLMADFAGHTSTWDEAISVNYRGYEIWECPPNGHGIIALMALNVLKGFGSAK